MKNRALKRLFATMVAASFLIMPLTASASDVADAPSETTATAEETVQAGTVSAGGTVITSTVQGGYDVKTLAGLAIVQPVAEISQAYGLAANEKPAVRAYDITDKTSPAAFVSITVAAEAIGADVVGAVNVDLGKISDGKFTQLPAGAGILTTVGIPGGKVDPNKTYAAVRVVPGGAFTILYDQDTNPYTVTFLITGGLAAYAIVAY